MSVDLCDLIFGILIQLKPFSTSDRTSASRPMHSFTPSRWPLQTGYQWEPWSQAAVKFIHSSKTIEQNVFPQLGHPHFVYKPMSYKYHWNLIPVHRDLLDVLVCVLRVEPNSVPVANRYPFVTVADRICYANSESKYSS